MSLCKCLPCEYIHMFCTSHFRFLGRSVYPSPSTISINPYIVVLRIPHDLPPLVYYCTVDHLSLTHALMGDITVSVFTFFPHSSRPSFPTRRVLLSSLVATFFRHSRSSFVTRRVPLSPLVAFLFPHSSRSSFLTCVPLFPLVAFLFPHSSLPSQLFSFLLTVFEDNYERSTSTMFPSS